MVMSTRSSMSKINKTLYKAPSPRKHPRVVELNTESFHRKPQFSSLNKSKDAQSPDERNKNLVPLGSKKEFVEKWLFNFNNTTTDSTSPGSSVIFDSPSPKRVPLSPLDDSRHHKRLKCDEWKNNPKFLTSPIKFKQNQLEEASKTILNVSKDNNGREKEDLMNNSFVLTPKLKARKKIITKEDLDSCRRIFFGSPKKASPEKKYFKPISSHGHSPRKGYLSMFSKLSKKKVEKRQIIRRESENDENIIIDDHFGSPEHQTNYEIDCESPRIIDSEVSALSPCILDTSLSNCASPLPIEIESLASPAANECTELDSNGGNELDQSIETEINETLNDDIEDSASLLNDTVYHNTDNNRIIIEDNDIDINKSPDKSSTKSENNFVISQSSSKDTNSTHFMGKRDIDELEEDTERIEDANEENDDIDKTLVAEEHSQKISQDLSSTTLSIHESQNKSSCPNNISLEASPPTTTNKTEWDNRTVVNPTVKRKKKPKKGSLVAKLQNLITSQTSFLRIWRHQLNRDCLEPSSRSVTIKVNRRIFQYGRIYISGTIIEDKFNLLDKSDRQDSISANKSTNNLLLKKSVTVLMAPEIVGKIKFNENNFLNIYQPWEVIDHEELILSVLYFTINVNTNDYKNSDDYSKGETSNIKSKEITIQQFNCPCLTAKQLVQSCDIKCTNIKPNVMQYIFDNEVMTM